MFRTLRTLVTAAIVATGFAMAAAPQTAEANSRLENAVYKAVVDQRGTKKVRHMGHEFNVKAVKITRHATGYTVKGRLSHHLSFRKDDQFHYTIDVRYDGTIRRFEEKINRGGVTSTLMTLKVGKVLEHAAKKKKSSVKVDSKTADKIIEKAGRWVGKKYDGKWEKAAREVVVMIGAQVALSRRLY